MASNLDFDPALLEEAKRLGGYKFKKDAVNAALREYIERHKQLEVFGLFNEVEYYPEYDYKQGRQKR